MTTASVSQQIVTAIIEALTSNTPAGENVFQSRAIAIERGETPAIVVSQHAEETARMSKGVDDNRLDVQLEIFVRGDPYDLIADPVYVRAHQIITTDPGIRACLSDVRKKARVWQADEGDLTAGVLVCIFEARYLSQTTDPTALV